MQDLIFFLLYDRGAWSRNRSNRLAPALQHSLLQLRTVILAYICTVRVCSMVHICTEIREKYSVQKKPPIAFMHHSAKDLDGVNTFFPLNTTARHNIVQYNVSNFITTELTMTNGKVWLLCRLHLKVALPHHNEECFSRQEGRVCTVQQTADCVGVGWLQK